MLQQSFVKFHPFQRLESIELGNINLFQILRRKTAKDVLIQLLLRKF